MLQYIFKTKTTLFSAQCMCACLRNGRRITQEEHSWCMCHWHRGQLSPKCVVCFSTQEVKYKWRPNLGFQEKKNVFLGNFHSAYKLKYRARMFAFACVGFLLLCGLNAAHLAGCYCTTEPKNTINTTLTKTTYGPHQQLHLSTEIKHTSQTPPNMLLSDWF